MVNMHSAHHHPLHAALVMRDPVNQKPHTGKGNQERKDAMNMRCRGRSGIVARIR